MPKTRKKTTEPLKRSRIASDIVSGLREAGAFSRGSIALPVRIVNIPDPVDIQSIRSHLGMSQADFANQYGFSVRTIQQWEQGRSEPDSAARAYLTVIRRNPQAVISALSSPT